MYCGLAHAYTNLWQPLFAYSDFVPYIRKGDGGTV